MTEKEAMQRCPLFHTLQGDELARAVAFFDGRRALYRKGDAVVRIGSPMRRFGLVLSGGIQVIQADAGGEHIIMAEASAGDTFGESLCFLQAEEAPVYVVSTGKTTILWLSCDNVRAAQADPDAIALRNRFIAMLARRTLSMNDRIQVLSKHSLREKLLAFFVQLARRSGERSFTLPFSRTDLAVYLGAHRSSLTRELGRMEADGLIAMDGRRILLKDRFPA